MAEQFDVIIVGTGAGGGTLAHTLAPSGKRILLLERGNFLTREPDNWDPGPVFVDGRYISPDTWYDGDGTPFQPQVHYFVGGATKMYGAALYRLRPEDFGEIRHVGGLSPAWPVSYADFEPWYTKAEWLYQVHGEHGEDPTEGPVSRQYPWPPVSHERRVQQISDALTQAGYHPFHAPCGVLLNETDRPASTCIRCATCDGYPCMVHAKADADIIAIRPVLDLPNVTLLVNSEVVRLQTDPAGRTVTGVVVDHGGDGKEDVYTADIVVLAAGAANSAKILLRSASDTHPAGLANGSGQVGRNYMFHVSKAVSGFGAEDNETVFQKTLGINDFYLAGDGREFPLGNIQMLGKSNAGAMKGEEPHLTKLIPGMGLDEAAKHAVDFWLTTEDLPRPENRVTLDQDGNIHVAYTESNQAEASDLYGEFRKILNHIGLAKHHVLHKNFYMSMNIPIAGVAHQAGTCRFGTDPATSVLDVNCKAHELDNLYVTDTSFFPSIGAVNPALTAIANGIRVGEHIAERLGVSGIGAWAPAQRAAPSVHAATAIGRRDLHADNSVTHGPAALSNADFEALYDRLRDGVRRDDEDRRGALTNIGSAQIDDAARSVSKGHAVSLSARVENQPAADNPEPWVHELSLPAGGPESDGLDFAMDTLSLHVHGDADSHIDALCHVSYDGTFYNDVPADQAGAAELSVDRMGNGIVGRGVLIDVPRLRGTSWLEPGDHVTVADLADAESSYGVHVGEGDLLFVRVGHRRRRRELAPWDASSTRAGLHPTAVGFLAERQVAVLGSDGNNDTAPSAAEGVEFPVQVLAIRALRLPTGTGSPVNPIAVL